MLKRVTLGLALLLPPIIALAQASGGLPSVTSTPSGGGGTTYSLTIQTLRRRSSPAPATSAR